MSIYEKVSSLSEPVMLRLCVAVWEEVKIESIVTHGYHMECDAAADKISIMGFGSLHDSPSIANMLFTLNNKDSSIVVYRGTVREDANMRIVLRNHLRVVTLESIGI